MVNTHLVCVLLLAVCCSFLPFPLTDARMMLRKQFHDKTDARLMLQKQFPDKTDAGVMVPERIGLGDSPCTNGDILIFQGPGLPLPSGIPTFTVTITNACPSGCSISDIHVKCGEFSSVNLIVPNLFKRVAINDCVVNDGEPLASGETIAFFYSNSFTFPLSVSSISNSSTTC